MKHILTLVAVLSALARPLYGQANKVLEQPSTTGVYRATQSITMSPGFSSGVNFDAVISGSAANCVALNASPSLSQNHVITWIPSEPFSSTAGFASKTVCEVRQQVQYFDGLGRLMQTVQTKASPTFNDIVQPVEYDIYGREARKFLPYASSVNNGSYKSDALSPGNGVFAFYSSGSGGVKPTIAPFARSNFEPSALGRLTEQGAAGEPWQPAGTGYTDAGHTVKSQYLLNDASSVRIYNALDVSGNDHERELQSGGQYGDGALYLTVTKSENWVANKAGTIEEYTDRQGRMILKRLWSDETTALSTYYVYDFDGNLSFVLPPGTNPDAGNVTGAALDDFGYQYRYDGRGRLIEKKLPGKGWENLVYDKLDRLIFTQDAEQVFSQTRGFMKYDVLDRVVVSGVETGQTLSRANLQNQVDTRPDVVSGVSTLWESRDNNATDGYTANTLPNSGNVQVLVVNYYDDYSFSGNVFGGATSGQMVTPRGLLAASRVKAIDAGLNQTLLSSSYYDERGRAIVVKSQNHLGGQDIITSNYDFTGLIVSSVRQHSGANNEVVKLTKSYEFDHAGRKVDVYHTVNNQSTVNVSHDVYDELGRLKTKNLHGSLQTRNYTYNERGWLTQINDPQNLTSNQAFGLRLDYATAADTYNGNIGVLSWRSKVPPGYGLADAVQSYSYSYDKLDRLTLANYTTPGNTGKFNEELSYDLMGNITSLKRTNSSSGYLNNFTYDYTSSGAGNKLWSVTDAGSEGRSGSFTYDANGNVKTNSQKQISEIVYNILNLPVWITKSSGNLAFGYTATGKKLRTDAGGITRDYVDGIDYVNGTIEQINIEDGRLVKNSGSYRYEYMLKDHLGNVRVIVSQDGSIIQVQDYYAFGREMNPGNSFSASPDNPYKYNGKEKIAALEEYDYGARFYDPVIGRWSVLDPFAEKYRRLTPFNYAVDNPLKYIDPDGMRAYPIITVTNEVVGKVDQTVAGYSSNSSQKPAVSQVNVYRAIVTDTEDPTFRMEFYVTRAGYAVTRTSAVDAQQKNGHPNGARTATNLGFEPRSGSSNTYNAQSKQIVGLPGLILSLKGNFSLPSKNRSAAAFIGINGTSNDSANGIEIHVGGYYLKGDGTVRLAMEYGCMGVVNLDNSPANPSNETVTDVMTTITNQAEKSKTDPKRIDVILQGSMKDPATKSVTP